MERGDVGKGQPPADRNVGEDDNKRAEITITPTEDGKVCIECPVCGYGVVRTHSYMLMRSQKCPHCLTSYKVVRD